MLQKRSFFVKLHTGQFTVPRFTSLSGALMCDSIQAFNPSLVLGFFLALQGSPKRKLTPSAWILMHEMACL